MISWHASLYYLNHFHECDTCVPQRWTPVAETNLTFCVSTSKLFCSLTLLLMEKSLLKPSMVLRGCNLNTEADAGGCHGQPEQHSEFEANLKCIARLYLKRQQKSLLFFAYYLSFLLYQIKEITSVRFLNHHFYVYGTPILSLYFLNCSYSSLVSNLSLFTFSQSINMFPLIVF